MDLLETQPYHDYDDAATQKIEMVPDKVQNVQVGVLIVDSKSYPIYEGISNIGRNSNCNIHLEDQSISKYHAEIEAHSYPTTSWISDLNSCNKTILNNIVLRPVRYYELKNNSIIQFGRIKTIYKSCHSGKELTIPETPERVDQNSVTVSDLKSPDSLLITHSTLNKNNCTITAIQEYSKKSVSCTFTNQSAREILQNMSKQNISSEINVNASCEQNDRNSSYESDDIFEAATQHVNIDSYLKNMQNSSLQKVITEKCDENISNIDNTTTMEQKCKAIGSTSTPIKKTNTNDQVEKLNSIERDLASPAIKRSRSKNDSSHSVKENNKKKKDNVDLNDVETQVITLPDCIPNPKKGQIDKEKNDIDNMETLNTQIIDFSGLPCRVNGSDKQEKEKNDTDIYPIDTQIINIESKNNSGSVKKLQANRIDVSKCNSSIEDIDYETASTQVIGEINVTNGKTFKLAKSNFQTDLRDEDDDILSRLPEVTISGTLSNSSTPVALVKRTNKNKRFHGKTKTADKSDTSSKMNKTKSIDKSATDTTLNENDKDSNKMTKSSISQKNKRSTRSMDKRSSAKENTVSVKSSNDKPDINTRSKTIKRNTRKKKNEIPKRNSRSIMINKESEEKHDTFEEEMGEESQEVAMIMTNSLINDNKPKNIGRKRKKLDDVNSNDNSLNNSSNVSRKGETSNEKNKIRVSRAKQKRLSKNNTSQSSLDSITDDSLISNDRNKRSPPSTRNSSTRNSSTRNSTNMEKEIDQNNTTILKKRRKNKLELLMDVEINIKTSSDTRKSISNVNSNSSFSNPKEKVLFTGLTDDEYVKVLKALGGVKVDDPSECTILVTDKIRRTTKFLCTLAKAMPIVSINWLLESKRAGHFLDWNNYLLKDPVMEAKYGFRLRKSLEKAKERQLLDGYTVLITPNIVSPPIPELKGESYISILIPKI